MKWRSWASIALLVLAACTQLPSIGGEDCGNGVIEPPEDCDTFGAESGAFCRPKGSVGECHLDCSRAAGGQAVCPSGWGCDLGGICRRPTGEFDPERVYEVGTAATLASGDFDGDGRADVLSAETADAFGVTRLKFHYFDEQGNMTDTRSFPHLLLSPNLGEMTGDTRRDVVFTDGRIGVLLGRPDRSWVPETFSSYRIEGAPIRMVTLLDELVEQTSGFVVLSALDGTYGVYVPDSSNEGLPRKLGPMSRPVDDLVGDPAAAHVLEGLQAPCKQLLFAMQGESAFSMIDACTRDTDGTVRWRSELVTQVVPLDPPEPIDAAPQVVDMNGDGHLDVIVGSGPRMFVSYGDGVTLAPAVPYVFVAANAAQILPPIPDTGLPMPLAAGDVTGDGVVDFVQTTGLLLSSPSTVAGQSNYSRENGGQPPWTVATVADFNSNGHLDVIAGSSVRPGLSFYNGTGTPALTFFAVPTSRPVQRMVSGDFDGDLIEDLAFTQPSANDDTKSSVMISFGAPFGAPLPPADVARVGTVEQMSTFREFMLSHLMLASSEGSGQDRRGVLTLLTGSGDRMPVALYELSTFGIDRSVQGSSAVRVVPGSFLGSGPGDLLALGFNEAPASSALEFWLLPALVLSSGIPILLDGGLPSEARPLYSEGNGFSLTASVADVDGDGRDEALVGVPAQDDEHCELLVYGIEPTSIVLRGSVLVTEPCGRVDLAPADVDLDGHVDIAWLTGRLDGSDRTLSVLWNDGAGAFASDRRTIIAGRGASPQAFAFLPSNAMRGAAYVYATALGLERVPLIGSGRELGDAAPLLSLDGCTGLTAADLNGDGAIDLVAAARGNLSVLEAALEAL